MGKIKVKCSWCGRSFERYPSQTEGKEKLFCCRKCLSEYRSKEHNPDDRPITRHPHLSEYNRLHNAERMTDEVREKLSRARSGTGKNPKNYLKYHGKHIHVVVAEKKIGRKLHADEVVHHIDGNRQNNSPDNLVVISRSEHARVHAAIRRGEEVVFP